MVLPGFHSSILMTNVGILAAYALVALIQPQWKTISIIRDWAALALTILCYNEMGWLAPARHRYEGEKGCIEWDRRFLKDWHMKAAIESCGSVFPIILELSYALRVRSSPCITFQVSWWICYHQAVPLLGSNSFIQQ